MKKIAGFALLLASSVAVSFAMSGVPGPGGSTPEPSTFLLVAIGLAAGGYAVYRGRRRKG